MSTVPLALPTICVVALHSEEPQPVTDIATVPLRANCGLLVNVCRALELLLGSEPSKEVMRFSSL